MIPSPYELFLAVQAKGYTAPMAAQITLESMTKSQQDPSGKTTSRFVGTGDHLKTILEVDRVNVFKCYFGEEPATQSSWLAGDASGEGMLLPLWAERLIHADVMVMQEKCDTTMDYLLNNLQQANSK